MDGPSDRNCSLDSLHWRALSLSYPQGFVTSAYPIRFYRLRGELFSSIAPLCAYGFSQRMASLELSFTLQKLSCELATHTHEATRRLEEIL